MAHRLQREFLLDNGIVFDETVKYGEDQVFDFAVYGRSRKTALISNKLYDYRVARKVRSWTPCATTTRRDCWST